MGEHTHGGTLFSAWLDLSLAVQQARAVKEALVKVQLDTEMDLERRFSELETDLLALDKAFREITEGHKNTAFFASLPLYDYLARRYQLDVQNMLLEPDTASDDKIAWEAVTYMQERHKAAGIIWKSPPNRETAGKLDSMGIRSVVFDPCLTAPKEGDFLTVMRQNVTNLSRFFQ